jgi:hypothetical protein
MTERRKCLRLALEPQQALAVRGHRRRQDLDRDVTTQPAVPGAIDLAHPADAEQADDLVGTYAAPRRE